MYNCSYCGGKNCYKGNLDDLSDNCPTEEKLLIEEVKRLYENSQNKEMAYNSALVESAGYCQKTRLEEIIDFSQRMGYRKLGIAFCVGLNNEARIFTKILQNHGFTVISVMCKNGSIQKEFIGIKEKEKVRAGTYEAMCNPIMQALILNKAETDFNIMLGLCVGHDSLFIKYSKAPITVFAAKDRVLAHNPLGAIYLAESYY